MSDAPTTVEAGARFGQVPDDPADATLGSATRLYLAILAALVALLIVLTIYPGWEALLSGRFVNLAPIASMGLSVMLGAIPVLICQVQTTARARQL